MQDSLFVYIGNSEEESFDGKLEAKQSWNCSQTLLIQTQALDLVSSLIRIAQA